MIESTIVLCILLLLAYLFDITFAKTKIPTVILLMILGWGVKQLVEYFEVPMLDLMPLLPVFGTIGLILIILEGSLELKMDRSKTVTIGKSFFISLLTMLTFVFGGAVYLYYFHHIPFMVGMINSIPFAVISSAISIPSTQNLCPENKEFAIYEGSFSDTLGVLFFNFFLIRKISEENLIGRIASMTLVIIILSLLATLLLSYLMWKIKHSVKYIPIILMSILLFSTSEYFHIPGLIFIMLFGIFLENSTKLSSIKFLKGFHPEYMNTEIKKFKDLTSEVSFLVRSVFFLLFGYLLKTSDLLNSESLPIAIIITIVIYLIRFVYLKLFRIDVLPLLFIAPRGLITIVLFLSMPMEDKIPFINQPLIVQVILLTALIMMIELVVLKPKKTTKTPSSQHG